ncbi:MAG: sulfur carrier protein ThiS [Alphaproteobacteria bacterium]|nr:sulfur carrier protein ThiS [Alphaproteobacteria bacterium]MBU2043022.1 sulfur carrier protein ThiS [Alphaproteobacteria bacterium]MBU2124393.1 sulfur carrier protein ThiS [Alphaproteobacteria bacterium]MBU2209305.1 sulfur carrier protein ThiS [Alphaproteobacteria bacterium]MBU2290519.1 sulfur carrier protein ThiS [Alphaproteobacteria bacterium]
MPSAIWPPACRRGGSEARQGRCRRRLPHSKDSRLPLIQVNGEDRAVSSDTILGLVRELGLDVRKVAVERNLEIVPRSLHEATPLVDGDRVELVQFVGGG